MGEPARRVVRPKPAVRWGVLLLAFAVALVLLAVVPNGDRPLDMGVFVVVLFLMTETLLAMHLLVKRFELRGSSLIYVDWLGRRQVIPGDDIKQAWFGQVPVGQGGSDTFLCVKRRSDAPPLVAPVNMVRREEILGLLGELDVGVDPVDVSLSRDVLRARLPNYRPQLRRPEVLGAGAVMLLIWAGVITVVAIV